MSRVRVLDLVDSKVQSSADGGELNRMLFFFYAHEENFWQYCEVDPEWKEEDYSTEIRKVSSSLLIQCRMKPSLDNPTFAIMGSTIFAMGEKIQNGRKKTIHEYGSTVQSFDIGNVNPDSTNLPEPLITPVVFVYKNKLYVFGRPVTSSSYVIAAAVLDPSEQPWAWEKLDGAPGIPKPPKKHRLLDEHSIYPAYIQENMVVLKFRKFAYIYNLDTLTWKVENALDYLPQVSLYRHHREQALVMGNFLYTPDDWDPITNFMSLRAYNLKEKIWLDDYVIMEPFQAHCVYLSRIGEKTICIVCAGIFSRSTLYDTTFAYCIKVDFDADVDKNTGRTVVIASNKRFSPCLEYPGMLCRCLPFSPEIAKNESIHHNGNKRQLKLATGDLDFTSEATTDHGHNGSNQGR